MLQPLDHKDGQIRDDSAMHGRVDANIQDDIDNRPKGPDSSMIEQSARPLERPVSQDNQITRPHGKDVNGRRSPPNRSSPDIPKEKVRARVLILITRDLKLSL